MTKLKNGIYATAMNNRIMNAYEEIEDEVLAESMLTAWQMTGTPDGNTLEDNIDDFGWTPDFKELHEQYLEICKDYQINPDFSKYVEEIKKNIVKMLDNPYYDMV